MRATDASMKKGAIKARILIFISFSLLSPARANEYLALATTANTIVQVNDRWRVTLWGASLALWVR